MIGLTNMESISKNRVRETGTFSLASFLLRYGFYITLVILFIIFSIFGNHFLTVLNLSLILSDCSSYFIMAAGITLVILCGNLDLSVSAVMLTSGIISIALVEAGYPVGFAVLVSCAVGVGVGLLNGFCVTKLNMNAFILTLGVQVLLRGVGLTVTNNNSAYTPAELKNVFAFRIGGYIPVFLIVAFCVMIIMQYVLVYTGYGRKLMATGCNREIARKIGLNTNRIITISFMFSGLFAALGGVVSATNIGSIAAGITGKGVDFLVATMVLIGGTSMFGGRGSIIPGSLFGVILMVMIENGLTTMGVDPYYMPIVRGIIIFAALFTDSLKYYKR